MSTSAVYPTGIAPALGHLNSSNNEIEIFVEDTSNKNIWRAVLKNFLPSGTKFNDPIQLGGRKKVIEECMNDQIHDSRKKLYIIDGDLDIIRKTKKPNLKNLYRLRSYCIENYLLNEEAIFEASTIMDPDCSQLEAKNKLKLDLWKSDNKTLLTRIFICYAVANKFAEDHKTVGYHVTRLTRSHPSNDNICPDKTFRRTFSLYKTSVISNDISSVKNYKNLIEKNCSTIDFHRFVSGKDYLLPLLGARLKNNLKYRLSDASLKVILAKSTSSSVDPYLARRLKKIILGK